MLDTGISQLGYDVTFELDKFAKPRLRGVAEIIKNTVLYICFSKPGQYPSLPWIGLDLESMLYSFYDDIREEDIKDQIINQCEALGLYFNNGFVNIRKTIYRGKPSLMIHIETSTADIMSNQSTNSDPSKYQIGITFNELDNMVYNVYGERG